MLTNSTAASPSWQARTPPELKWLLNERAALAGEFKVWSDEINVVDRRIERLQRLLLERQAQLSALSGARTEVSNRIAALDRTIELGFPSVHPAAAGVVKAWARRYGERGALTRFLRDHLRGIAPVERPLAALQELVIVNFDLVLQTPRERQRLKRSISTVLRRLRDKHEVLASRDNWVGRNNQPLWRWKQPDTLDDLRRAAEMPLNIVVSEAPRHERAPDSNEP